MALYTVYEFMKKVGIKDISLIADMETQGFLSPANQTAEGTRYYSKQQVKMFDYLYSLYVDHCRKQIQNTIPQETQTTNVNIVGHKRVKDLKPLQEDFTQTKQDYEYTFTVNVIPPTCTKKGYTEHICNENKIKSFKDNEVPALGHNYIENIIPPTCVEDGGIEYTCSHCGHSYSNPIPAKGHQFKLVEKTEAMCEVAGHIKYQCADCQTIKSELLPALSHQFVETIESEGDCTHPKIIKSTCSICNKTDIQTIEAKGHDFEVEEKEATCETEGYKKQTCKCCNFSELLENIPAKGHSFVETLDFEPTSTLTGQKTLTCSICNHKETEVIPCLKVKSSMLDRLQAFKQENSEVIVEAEEQAKQYEEQLNADITPIKIVGKKRKW